MRGFVHFYILGMIYWSLLTPCVVARELILSCALLWSVLKNILIFPNWNPISHSSFIFLRGPMLEYTWQYHQVCPFDKLLEIQQLAYALLLRQPFTVCQGISFLGKSTICVNHHAQLHRLCHAIQSDMLKFYHSPAHLLHSFHLSLPILHQVQRLSWLWQVSGTHVISPSWCHYCYQCYAPLLGLLFSALLGLPSPVVARGMVLYARCILPCKNSRMLLSSCIKWPSSYPIRWLP